MTGLSDFDPGAELRCDSCEFRVIGPDCRISIEMRGQGEPMTPACCPTRVCAGQESLMAGAS